MWVNLIIFQFPWNSQLSALLFTTGTFPGFGHVTSQMSHSQWSNEQNEKEGTCPNWKLVLCTLNKKRYMFLNSMVQKKKLKKNTTPLPPLDQCKLKPQTPCNLAQTICCSRFCCLDITVGVLHGYSSWNAGHLSTDICGCRSLLLGLGYKTISLEMRKFVSLGDGSFLLLVPFWCSGWMSRGLDESGLDPTKNTRENGEIDPNLYLAPRWSTYAPYQVESLAPTRFGPSKGNTKNFPKPFFFRCV